MRGRKTDRETANIGDAWNAISAMLDQIRLFAIIRKPIQREPPLWASIVERSTSSRPEYCHAHRKPFFGGTIKASLQVNSISP